MTDVGVRKRPRIGTGTWVLLGVVALVAAVLLGRAWGAANERSSLAPVRVAGTVVTLDPASSTGCIQTSDASDSTPLCGPLHPARRLSVAVGDRVEGFELAGIAADGTDVRILALTAVDG